LRKIIIRKFILLVLLITFSNFLLPACNCKGKKGKPRDTTKLEDLTIRVDNNVKNPDPNDVVEREKAIRKEIESETYGPKLHKVRMIGVHFYYESNDKETYIGGDCGLFAVLRFLHHAGQLGAADGKGKVVDKDLWKRYSNQQLRDIIADNPDGDLYPRGCGHGREAARKQGIMLDQSEIKMLLTLLGAIRFGGYSLLPN
jgi:hypothetical protein